MMMSHIALRGMNEVRVVTVESCMIRSNHLNFKASSTKW